jgi:hypothetical protein
MAVSAAEIQRAIALFEPVWDLFLVPERFRILQLLLKSVGITAPAARSSSSSTPWASPADRSQGAIPAKMMTGSVASILAKPLLLRVQMSITSTLTPRLRGPVWIRWPCAPSARLRLRRNSRSSLPNNTGANRRASAIGSNEAGQRCADSTVRHLLSAALQDNEELRARVAELLRSLYGRSSERFNPEQLSFGFLAVVPESQAASEPEPAASVEGAAKGAGTTARGAPRVLLPAGASAARGDSFAAHRGAARGHRRPDEERA